MILRIVFAVAAVYCLIGLLGWGAAHDPQPTPTPPRRRHAGRPFGPYRQSPTDMLRRESDVLLARALPEWAEL